MREKPYYSVRTGKYPAGARLDLPVLRKLFLAVYHDLCERGHFQEVFGYYCVDQGDVPGNAGSDSAAFVLRKLRKDNLWPVSDAIESYSEDDLFDVIELLHDCASQGTEGYFHSYANCGMHYHEFDRAVGRADYRVAVNELLRDYADGYELSANGEVTALLPSEIRGLAATPLPQTDRPNVGDRVDAAILKFRNRHSTWDERRDAIRDLADVLEYLRPQLKVHLLEPDERDLFHLANQFGIRHHNQQQKTQYDKAIWYSWLFHYYLATIHAATRLIEKHRPA